MVTQTLTALVGAALEAAARDGLLRPEDLPRPEFEHPKRREHGDWATNVALIAGRGQTNPRELAAALVERLPPSDLVAKVDVAGPGFLNFHLTPVWLHDVLRKAADISTPFGRSTEGKGRRVNVEYVSSNPTGPVNVVSGRHAAVGDALAALLEVTGFAVTREFLVNDVGRQIELFGESVAAHYLRLFGRAAEVPPDGYHGDYVADLAKEISGDVGDELVEVSPQKRNAALAERALAHMVPAMEASLERFGTRFDIWFSERKLHETGAIRAAVDRLQRSGMTEVRDGALWFKSSQLGDDKDRVVLRSSGTTTYLAADIAYLLDKFGRGFDHLLYLWGADHHGTVPRMLAAAEALGFGRDRVEICLLQNVSLLRGGRAVKASKRAGEIVPLDELVDEVGADAARYTFLTRSIDAPLEFDIELAKEQAPTNPVYYVQYAHARICSILRRASERGLKDNAEEAPLHRLEHPSEEELLRKLASYEEMVPLAARGRAPQKVTRYLEELASLFSAFYRDCKVISDDSELSAARLVVCRATKRVIADGLGLLGVSAPERM